MMKNNPVKQLEALGQSIWLDHIRRDLIAGGGVAVPREAARVLGQR